MTPLIFEYTEMKLLMNAYRHVMESLVIDLNFKCSIKLSCIEFWRTTF